MRAAYVDAPWTPGLPGLVNVQSHPATGSPFPSIQAAVDYVAALPGRGRLYCPVAPAGRYSSTSTPSYSVGLEIPQGVRVFGDGYGSDPGGDYGTIFDAAGQDPDQHMAALTGSYSGLEYLAMEGPNAAGDGCGVVFGPAGNPMRHAWVQGVSINDPASWGVYVYGDASNICILSGMKDDCRITNLNSNGAIYVGPGSYVMRFEGVNMPVSPLNGQPIVKVEGSFDTTFAAGCTFESTADCTALECATGGDYVRSLTVDDCYFEMHHATPTRHIFEFTADDGAAIIGARVSNNHITRYNEGMNAKVLLARASGAIPHHNLLFDGNNIYENKVTETYDDISIEDVSHAFILRGNMVWNRSNGATRGLYFAAGSHTGGSLDWDYRKFQFPPDGTDRTGLQGAAYRNILQGKTRIHRGDVYQTVNVTTEGPY